MSTPNRFRWYELMTNDTAAAGDFYSHVVGWKLDPMGEGADAYTRFLVGDAGVGGMMAIPEEECDRAKPGWIGYVAVDDVDDYAARVTRAGGAVLRAPADIPGILRFAVVADPAGAPFVIFRGTMDGDLPEIAPGTQGTTGWHELYSGAVDDIFPFYSGLFGWTKDEAMPMGEQGVYQLFAAGSEAVGAMMKKPEEIPGPAWNFYFCVDDIDAAIARIGEKDGTITMGPHQVPGDAWIVQALDPQGAAFSLVGARP
ncbi:VOC family protein [Parvibaculum sp.]|jgi:hypothetical protein|uniref:VOC family protein n=1 Tax=Parvibaculum sp. TaxID=2024848 RepID=UPI000C4B4EF6|nr:VOC family protein [Parvibaculum sp.]HAC58023.1 glyoxalase [Rhodobiaceae bacterium]MAU61313.1 glyoxalase [Parvibaculum sp.]MBO6667385.1 VOC family protein [Parvibaculum sp.]MBO6693096.1 VOC family protein [Parvibaculum sp.]MBO6713937.1 VOC family protein [Parvibaculum sp.]|tara:strand:- start:9438 stop:10205 length:768 start_codon:yes stop_codon:yes gene_type:complete